MSDKKTLRPVQKQRVPMKIAMASGAMGTAYVAALCSDRTIWTCKPGLNCVWSQLPDIPQHNLFGEDKHGQDGYFTGPDLDQRN